MYQAEKIREAVERGATYNELAQTYGVSRQTIKSIVQKKSYISERGYGKTLF